MRAFKYSKVVISCCNKGLSRHSAFYSVLIILCCCSAITGWAQTASSSGYGGRVDIQLVQLFSDSAHGLLADIERGHFSPTPSIFVRGDSSFGPFENSANGIDLDLSGTVKIESGALSSMVYFDQPILMVTGIGEAEDTYLRLVLFDSPGAGTFSQADWIASESVITGNCGALEAEAVTTIINGEVVIDDNVIALPQNPAPNTIIDLAPMGWPGTVIILNEQIITGDYQSELDIITNAMHVVFDISDFNVELTGEIIFGRSQAMISGCNTSP